MAYQSFDANGVTGLALTGGTLEEVFANAAVALTDFMTPLAAVEPRQPEEVDVAAPELEVLLVDFLTELLYRFDTRGWLTRTAEVELRERDGGWSLEGTLLGERWVPGRHDIRRPVKAVSYHGLEIHEHQGLWHAAVELDLAIRA